MARTPDGLTPRTVMVSFRLRQSQAAELDRLRGNLTRTAYLEGLIKAESKKNPKPEHRP